MDNEKKVWAIVRQNKTTGERALWRSHIEGRVLAYDTAKKCNRFWVGFDFTVLHGTIEDVHAYIGEPTQ